MRTVASTPAFTDLTAVAAFNSTHVLAATRSGGLFRVAVNSSTVTQLPPLANVAAVSSMVTDPSNLMVYVAGQCQVFVAGLLNVTAAVPGGRAIAAVPIVGSPTACQTTPATGAAADVRLTSPAGMALDPNLVIDMITDGVPAVISTRTIYVADTGSNNIRALVCALTARADMTTSFNCTVDILVGSPDGLPGFTNDVGPNARLTAPMGIAYYNHPSNGPVLYVCATGNQALRYVLLGTKTLTSFFSGASYYPSYVTIVPWASAALAGSGSDLMPFAFNQSSSMTYGLLPAGLQKTLNPAVPGSVDGPAGAASFSTAITCVRWDADLGLMFVCDAGNAKLRAVSFL